MGRPSVAMSGMTPGGWRPRVAAVSANTEATLWVDAATGDDSRSKATVAGSNGSLPWQTIGRASWGSTNRAAPNTAEAASAGDIVSVAAGTYSTAGTASRFDVAYNPANSGTSGAPIIFRAAGAVTLTLSSSSGPVIGANNRDHIEWDGFTINEASAAPISDTGPVTFFGSDFCRLERVTITGIVTSFGDNHNGVRVEFSNSTVIRNNTISGIGDDNAYGLNSAGVMLYDSSDTIIEHNNFTNCGTAVYVKGAAGGTTQRRTIIRYNLITTMGAYGLVIGPAARYGKTYQNIIRPGGAVIGIRIYDFGATEGQQAMDEIVANNTIYGSVGFDLRSPAGSTNTVANNIVASGGTLSRAIESPATSMGTSEIEFLRNLYYGYTNVATLDVDGSAVNHGLASWQATYSQDLNSSTADPVFVNAASADFHLDGTSPALTLGRVVGGIGGANGDTIAAGAYISGAETIGVE